MKLGVSVINPKAAKALDYIYLGVDYAVDRALVGEEQAIKNAIVKTAVTTIFNKVKFEDLGGRTIADYTENRIGKLTFPMLQKAFRNNEQLQFELSKIIKGLGTDATEDLVFSIVNELENAVNLERSEVKSPVELRVYDSRGAVTGLLNGEVEHGISRSVYYKRTVTIFYLADSYRYEVAGTGDGTYGLTVTSFADEVSTFTRTNVPTSPRAVHQYTVDWDALGRGEPSIGVQIDSDGDGVFEEQRTLQPPIASFAHSPENPVAGEEITFDASESYDPDGEVVSYEWHSGDGNISSGKVVTHAYATGDDYAVTLIVTDSDGALSTYSRVIVVGQIAGDATGDGNINAIDITKVERIIAGLDAETPGADANQDGKIDAIDITKVERLIAGLD